MANFKGFKVDGVEYPWGDYVTVGQAEGSYIGQHATAEGYQTTSDGLYTHAEGQSTIARGQAAHAEGKETSSEGTGSHAEGGNTEASGDFAHAEGNNTEARGYNAHAEGIGTKAMQKAAHVFGTYNIADQIGLGPEYFGTYVEIVGNGENDNTRSNARTLDWDGNEILAGKLTVGTNPVNAMDVTTKQYVDNKLIPASSTLEATKWTNLQYTVTLSGVTNDSLIMVAPATNSQADYFYYNVTPYSQTLDEITFSCTEQPPVDIIVNILVV